MFNYNKFTTLSNEAKKEMIMYTELSLEYTIKALEEINITALKEQKDRLEEELSLMYMSLKDK